VDVGGEVLEDELDPPVPIDRLLENAGLRVAPLEKFYAKGPKAFGYLFVGVATKA